MRMGFDGREAERGMNAMLAKNAENAAKTRTIWAEADRAMAAEKREAWARDIEREEARVAATKAAAAERLVIEEAMFAEHERIAAEEAATWSALEAEKLAAKRKADAQEIVEEELKNKAILAEDIETASRRNKARAIYRERDAAAEIAQARINAEIAAGSGGWGAEKNSAGTYIKDAAGKITGVHGSTIGMENAGKYGFDAAGKLATVGGKAVKEIEEAGGAAHGMGSIFREISVLFREGMRGNLSRMIGSFTLLVQYVAATAIALPALLITAGLAAVAGPDAWRTWKARSAAKASTKEEGEKEKGAAEILRKRVEDLQRAGTITDKQADAFKEELKNGNINAVFHDTAPLVKNATAAEQVKNAETAKEVARIHADAQKEQEAAALSAATPGDKYNSLLLIRMQLQDKMNDDKKDAVQYAKDEVELAKLNLEINKAQKDVAKEQAEAAQKKKEHERETFELNKQYQHEMMEGQRKQSEIDSVGFEAPTIAQLAGRGFNSRLEKYYGKGGRGDLESGNGPYAGYARDALRAQKQMIWDLEHGNASFDDVKDDQGRVIGQRLSGGTAYDDLQRRRYAENQLRGAGLDTPEMKQNRMAESLDAINSNIAQLFAKATGDGITINTGQQ